MIRAYLAGSQPKMRTGAQLVEVEDYLLWCAIRRRFAAEQGILPAGLEALVVKAGTETLGYRLVRLFSAAQELQVKPLLKRLGMLHRESGIVVLVREILEHPGMAAVLEPMELVLSPVSMAHIHPLHLGGGWGVGKDNWATRRSRKPLACREIQGYSGTLWQATEMVGLH